MPANNDQDWADDGAFWDEAWADMNRRLDEAPRKRRVAWWWYAGAFMALLLVVSPTVWTHIFNDSDGTKTEQRPNTPAPLKTPALHPAVAPENEVYADDEASRQAPLPVTATTNDAPLGKPKKSTIKSPETRQSLHRSQPSTPRKRPARTSPLNVAKPAVVAITELPSKGPEQTALPPKVAASQGSVADEVPRQVPAAVFALAQAELPPLPIPNSVDLPVIINGKSPRSNALTLEAGALGTTELTGFYAGLGYRFKLSGRWSVPLAARYRKEKTALTPFPVSGGFNDQVSAPTNGFELAQNSVIVNSLTSGTIAVDIPSGQLSTDAIETRIGLQYAVSPRLRIGSGVSAAYLWRGDLDFQAISVDVTTDLASEINVLRGNFNDFDYTLNSAAFEVTDGRLPNFSPLHLRTYLDLNYQLTTQLSITVGGSLLLQQPDRNEVAGLPAGRAFLGVGWRLR